MSTDVVAPAYPVSFSFDPPETVARWRPLVHWLLAIPHFVVLYALAIVASVFTVIAWFAGVFTGKIPEGIQGPIAMYLRYNVRVTTYLMFLRGDYPPFAFDAGLADAGADPLVRVDVTPQLEGRNRLTIFFRYFMLLPQIFVLLFVFIGLYVVMIIGFFAVLILGRWPVGLRNYVIGSLRWSTRLNGYSSLLTDEYPPFGFN
ncbi:MAG: hypothetical protein JWR35_1984 [Marmoricola sp.]|jgi:hypothetical protein|nr:hypothetical protein [Marmoricola sp.]